MQPQRETLTDNLADIIQILQIGFRSGTLTVERGEGPRLEEGYLIFVNGRVVDARTSQYTNWSAFNYLKTWGSCRFSFDSGISPPPNPMSPSPPIHGNGNGNGNGNGRTGVSGPMNGYAAGNFLPGTPPSFPAFQSGSLTRIPARLQAGEAALNHPDARGLPRTHRRLLLLINGQRNCPDLARLMSRNSDEVQALLDDLEQAGFIHQ